jgi:predicted nucleotidyltransferase component of viral defense system
MITSARSLGFSAEAEARDRSQMSFLSSLMRQGADRYILKGGMAMRALYGSARLTKDVDFDCEDSLSSQSMSARITRALQHAGREAGLTGANVDQTKDGERASRWRLTGATREGVAITWEVELSRRGVPHAVYIETTTIQPPFDYRVAPFVARVYAESAMVASKVNALLSDLRSVPRDVYDLYDLASRGATPVELWIGHLPREMLDRKKAMALDKISAIGFELANSELLPYLARDLRATIDAKRWDDIRLAVAEVVGRWFDEAIPKAKTAKEMNRDADSDFDLAGR